MDFGDFLGFFRFFFFFFFFFFGKDQCFSTGFSSFFQFSVLGDFGVFLVFFWCFSQKVCVFFFFF